MLNISINIILSRTRQSLRVGCRWEWGKGLVLPIYRDCIPIGPIAQENADQQRGLVRVRVVPKIPENARAVRNYSPP